MEIVEIHKVVVFGIGSTNKVSNYSYCRLWGVLLVNVAAGDTLVI